MKASGPSARASSAVMCSAMRLITVGMNGGLASKHPARGEKSKKLPTLPNAPSVSSNALQKRAYRELSGDAKHSILQSKCSSSASKHSSFSAACVQPHAVTR